MAALHGAARAGRVGGYGGGGGGGRVRRRRGDVRAAVLMLLAEEPLNGYQLMQAIEGRSGGRWRPSPGSVYPTLAQLEDEGLIRATKRDGGKLFELSTHGREHVAARHQHAPPWSAADDAAAGTFFEMRSLVMQADKAASEVAEVGSEQQVQRARQILVDARRSLYRLLAEDDDD
jgi:DNA-binding PadR family transcriptional regulator